ncbi:general transcription factor 3C polypeptide 2-like protein [Dinothrombium tinctorium]|uniref:General transcription factor 3C polypeptide 2-like protein n=1 Tax=Dinothrombium tinctorium TaxID=1965070 RepID=A0A3S3P2W7_9ACAR|nr:general transcription factor 3C polypeptide 2-like protein [Dinothrombium tinctorium]
MVRKRLKSDHTPSIVANERSEAEAFTCSSCKRRFNDLNQIEQHITQIHYGLAKINEETNGEYTQSEMLKAFVNALKSVKVLKCWNENCGKSYKSALGFRTHLSMCGKSDEELLQTCEICKRKLKFVSMKAHMRTHESQGSDNENSEAEIIVPNDVGNGKSRRRSALNSSDSDSCHGDDNVIEEIAIKPNKAKIKDKIPPQKSFSSLEMENKKKKLFKLLKDYIKSPSLRKTSEMKLKWEVNENNEKFAKCPIEGCNQKYTTRQGLAYHFQRCGIPCFLSCKLCEFKVETERSSMINHLLSLHQKELPPLDSNLVACLLGQRRPHVSKCRGKQAWFINTKTEAIDFYTKHYKKEVLTALLPRKDIWIPLSEEEYSMYVPEAKISPFFKITTIESDWQNLHLFDCIASNDHLTCFVGGAVWSAAWCPLPLEFSNKCQYIAVATCKNSDAIHPLNHLETEKGLLQIWDCGLLNKEFSKQPLPRFSLGIAHNYGVIWDLEWCPGGTSWQPFNKSCTTNILPRLGLLALACGDGIVRILSIPHPSSLINDTKIYRCEPVVILDPPGTGPAGGHYSTICRCLSWRKTDEQKLIAAGFGNGVVAVWDLVTISPLLVIHKTSSQTILRPKYSWNAHGALINDLKWLPYSSQLTVVTASFDRCLKLWDLEDLSNHPHYVDESNWQASNYVIFKDVGYLNWAPNSLTAHRGCVWDIALSDWVNAEISVDSGGEAVIFTNFVIRHDSKHGRRKPMEKLPFYRLKLEELPEQEKKTTSERNDNTESQQSLINVNWTINREKPLQRSYSDMVKTYGVIFHDIPLDFVKIQEKEIKRIRSAMDMQYQRLSDYPLSSLTKVEWNPNKSSYNWVLTAGQSGFMRISCIKIADS